jgi:hypothetical protein
MSGRVSAKVSIASARVYLTNLFLAFYQLLRMVPASEGKSS